MTSLSSAPNLSNQFEKLKLILDLETYITHNPKTITGKAILDAIEGKKFKTDEILQYVKDQATDSFNTMCNCIGAELTTKILNFKL